MDVHIIAPVSGISFRDLDHSAATRRRRNLLIIVGLSVLSWALIGVLVWGLA